MKELLAFSRVQNQVSPLLSGADYSFAGWKEMHLWVCGKSPVGRDPESCSRASRTEISVIHISRSEREILMDESFELEEVMGGWEDTDD